MTFEHYYENGSNESEKVLMTERVSMIPTTEIFIFILITVLSFKKNEETEAWKDKELAQDHVVVTGGLGFVPRRVAAKWELCYHTCLLSTVRTILNRHFISSLIYY